MKYGFVFTILFALSLNVPIASATEVWSFKVESAPRIIGGKLKVMETARTAAYRTVRFKYKLNTTFGPKEDWAPYNLPHEIFDPVYLAGLSIGETRDLGTVPHAWESGTLRLSLRRVSIDAYLLATSGLQLKFFVNSRKPSGPWSRVEVDIGKVKVYGNLSQVTDE